MTGAHSHPAPEVLQVFLDGELSEDELRKLNAHLDGCTGCRADLQALQTLFDGIEILEQEALPDPGPRFSRRVMAEIVRRDAAERVRRNRVIVPAAAAALLALILALWLMPSPGLPIGPRSMGDPAVPALMGALLKVVHSGVVMVVEGADLALRLARTVSTLTTALPGAVWAVCLSLMLVVHGALAYCLRQYGRRYFARS